MSNKKLYKTITILSIIALILPISALAQEKTPIEVPGTFEEAKALVEKIGKEAKEQLPSIIETLWKESVLPLWRKMYGIWSNWWDSYIQPWLQSIWQKILGLLGQEIKKRKPMIEEEFEKEKEELKEEIKEELPEVKKSLWERFKELIK